MNHDEILKLLYAVSHATEANAPTLFDVTNMFRPVPVLIKNSLNEKHFDLFSASGFMYQSLFNSVSTLDAIATHLENFQSRENEALIEIINRQTQATLMAMRIATEGA